MEFSLFKRYTKWTTLFAVIFEIAACVIGIAVVGGTYTHTSKHLTVAAERFVLFAINGVVMSLVIWILHSSQSFVGATYIVTKKTYITKTKKITVTKFENPWWLHLVTVILLIGIFFLSITGLLYAYHSNKYAADPVNSINKSWILAIQKNWWLALTLFFVNLISFEFAYNANLYLFNRDPKILNELK